MAAPVLETERLTLRGFLSDDVAAFAQVLADREAMWDLWSLPGVPDDELDYAKLFIEPSIKSWRTAGYGFWAVRIRAPALGPPGELIGFCGFVDAEEANCDRDTELEVGWGIRPDYQGRGLASEAARATLDWAFANLDRRRLVAITDFRNKASRKLMERLGFVRAGVSLAYGVPAVRYTLSRPAP